MHLKFFTAYSGLKINMGKSMLARIKVEDETMLELAEELGCEIG